MLDSKLENRTFLILLAVVSIAFAWLLLPFYGAVFWGTILAIIFTPVHRRLQARLGGRRNLAALITLSACILIVILPVIFITGSLVQEGANLYQSLKSGQLNLAGLVQQAFAALPPWAHQWLERFDLGDLSSLQEKLSSGAMQASQFVATKAFSIGQNTFDFVISFGVMLYLLFFLLRDGRTLGRRIKQAVPLDHEHKQHLFTKFTTVVRATVKGNIAVAATQGALGGLIFWFLGIQGSLLWGTLMAFLSLLPAIGAGLVWVPVAAWFLLTGAIWQGVVLILFCVLVIGLVDNILRPILVGKDTKMPDYVVLISTLGGMSLFGLNGFVIGPLIAALFIASWDLFTGREETEDLAG
ncbi:MULTISPECIES: AI-2E family transporter [unclassified Pseudomonas]|uniref:AI-2E family transporter n=1 Tax=unclassified Pseudomonas TaxID=196821 RepID=UPI0004D99B78|nr:MULTISPECIES: AI-2E family transporter [unclassified Pseudomonas]KES22140.1 membrane protein [Pseudomonas sp. AAC]OHR75265.1 AI-2E family transporter [Pseudomonas sp. HMSC75E02]